MLPGGCALRLLTPLLQLARFSGHPDALQLAYTADSFGVPRNVMYAVAYAETRYNASNAQRSKAGARGRMQINPRVWKCRYWRYRDNLACGAAILYFYYRTTGNWSDAVYRYCGTGAAARQYQRIVERELGRLWWREHVVPDF